MKIIERPKETKLGTRIAYAFGTLADNLALQNFMFLGFAYYFTVAELPVWMIFVAWGIYSVCYKYHPYWEFGYGEIICKT
jgi:hypothetical protein